MNKQLQCNEGSAIAGSLFYTGLSVHVERLSTDRSAVSVLLTEIAGQGGLIE